MSDHQKPGFPVCVIGGGSWGTALARQIARQGRDVRLWVHDASLAATIAATRRNEIYLPGFELPAEVHVTSKLTEACRRAGAAILAVPSRHCRAVLEEARSSLAAEMPLIVASKGIEQRSLLRVSQVTSAILGRPEGQGIAILSGPSFAREVAAGSPTAIVAAARSDALSRSVQALLSSPDFRVYTSDDVTGVELGGALKNVVAIAAGIVEGVGLGSNTLAALITRGLAEISRLSEALGGRRETLAGLAGLGDLVLTCTGSQSRNRQVGKAIGEGRPLAEILEGMKMVAEGVDTTRAARDLGARTGISMPITEQVHEVLFGGKPPSQGIRDLMGRPPRTEID